MESLEANICFLCLCVRKHIFVCVSNTKNRRKRFQFWLFKLDEKRKYPCGFDVRHKILPQKIPFSFQLQATRTLIFTSNWCSDLCLCIELSLLSDCVAPAWACLAASVPQCHSCATFQVRVPVHCPPCTNRPLRELVLVQWWALLVGFYKLQTFRKQFRLVFRTTIEISYSQHHSYIGNRRAVAAVLVSFTITCFSSC